MAFRGPRWSGPCLPLPLYPVLPTPIGASLVAQTIEPASSVGDPGSIPGSGKFPGEGNGSPLQYSCLENSMDRGDWWATVRGAAKSWSDWETNTVRESAITRDSFFIRKTYLHGIANICLTIICSSHLLTVPLLFEVPDPYCLLLSVRWYICLNCQTIFESRWGFCKYVIKLNFVFLICFISIQVLDQQNIILDEHFPGSYTANPILLICETCLYSSRSS